MTNTTAHIAVPKRTAFICHLVFALSRWCYVLVHLCETCSWKLSRHLDGTACVRTSLFLLATWTCCHFSHYGHLRCEAERCPAAWHALPRVQTDCSACTNSRRHTNTHHSEYIHTPILHTNLIHAVSIVSRSA